MAKRQTVADFVGADAPADAPKVLFWDIETTPILAWVWELRADYISHENVERDWSIICAAWKWLGSDEIGTVCVNELWNDRNVCKRLRETLLEADIIVGQNGDRFDTKKLSARMIVHDMPPMPVIPSVDTLKIARRRFKFTSNRLDFVSKALGSEGKMETRKHLWLDVIHGDRDALAEMVAYNRQDVIELERVYLKLRPWIDNHPNLGLLIDADMVCPNCGSGDVKRDQRGDKMTRTRRYRRYVCRNCGAYSWAGAKAGGVLR